MPTLLFTLLPLLTATGVAPVEKVAPSRNEERLRGTPAELLTRILDDAIAQLAPARAVELNLPQDELHSEILLPLLPAMLRDKALRQHWRASGGFFRRLSEHLEDKAQAPQWLSTDFEINVAATYAADLDAKALADTLLSEDTLREYTAGVMNQLLARTWPQLPKSPTALTVAQSAEITQQIPATSTPVPAQPSTSALRIVRLPTIPPALSRMRARCRKFLRKKDRGYRRRVRHRVDRQNR